MNESLIEPTTVEISGFGDETNEILRRFPAFHECEQTMNRFPRKGFQVKNIIRGRLESLKRRIARRLDKLTGAQGWSVSLLFPLPRLRGRGPMVLTVNGKAEVVVQDAAAYQRLVDQAAQVDREEAVAAIREGLADAEAGRVKPARKALNVLAKKYGIPTTDV
jgi:hypothetical protein